MNDWLFNDPPNLVVITTNKVLQGNPILYVSHDRDDGGWQFHTGEALNINDAKLVSLQQIIKLDSSVKDLADLPLGWIATRESITDNWLRSRSKN